MVDDDDDRDQSSDRGRERVPRPRGENEPPPAWRTDQRHRTPLITNRLESSAWTRLPRIDAHCTYVLAYGGGELVAFKHTPRFGDRTGSVRCYVVDMAPRSVRGTLRIPARTNLYSFDATYDAQWQVADPTQVVRANVEDGDGTVAGFLMSRLEQIGRQYDPDDSGGVSTQIYTMLGAAAEAGGLPVGNGLALIALNVQVTPDPIVMERGVARDHDVHEGTLIERRTMRLGRLLNGDGSEILLHLAQNPTDTETVLRMITEAKEKSERLRLEWLDRMRADDAIQEADYEHARAAVLRGGSASSPALTKEPFVPWPNPTRPIIDSDPSTVPPPRRPDNPFPPYDPAPGAGPTPPAAEPPPPFDPDPFTQAEHVPPPATPAESSLRAPRDVQANRLTGGSVLVRWRDVGDVEYRVRRLDGDRWQDIATTNDTFIDDSDAPPGAVRVYSVSAAAGGVRSSETHSGS